MYYNSRKTHCPKGHPLSGDNLVKSQLKFGRRACRVCYNERHKLRARKKRQDVNWYKKLLENQNIRYKKMPKKDKQKLLATNRKRWNKNKVKYNKQKREEYYPKYSLNLKTKVFYLCGRGEIKCLDCGISDIDVLTLDHTNGRKQQEKGKDKKKHVGKPLYVKVIRSNNSEGYETVCFNCNWKRHLNRLKKSKQT